MNLQAFMLPEEELNKEVVKVVSKRYKEPFKFKGITPKRDAEIKNKCVKYKVGAKGKQEAQFDATGYQHALIMECLVYPDLNSVELQDYYKVMGAENLFDKMFNANEVAEMFLAVQEANGYETTFDELVEEAKN